MKEVRLIGKLVVVYLAVVGGFTLLHQLRPWISPATSNAPEHTSFYPSPDGKFRAAIVTFAGGGAISPYCHDAVSVIPATAPDRDAAESHLNVYEGACQSFALKEGVKLAAPQVEWLSDTSLRIGFSIDGTSVNPATVRLKKRDASGQVNVQFFAHE